MSEKLAVCMTWMMELTAMLGLPEEMGFPCRARHQKGREEQMYQPKSG
ncbi:MAG: hypothetical protein ACLSFA_14215 [Roseburia inulinivorans]